MKSLAGRQRLLEFTVQAAGMTGVKTLQRGVVLVNCFRVVAPWRVDLPPDR
jgi:hypothetical protein